MTLVSVLMPVAAPAPFLRQALQSVVDQTFTSWELVLVVDGPAAGLSQLARSIVPVDRLTIVGLDERRGVAGALNAGLEACRGDLVARLDADDVAHRDRLATQVAYFEARPEIALLGSPARLIDTQGRPVGERQVVAGADVRRPLLTRNRLVHSSVMMSRRVVERADGYDVRCDLREDYELWLRMARHSAVANVDRPLVDYRLHSAQVSHRRPTATSLRLVARAQRELARDLGVNRVGSSARRWAWRAGQSPHGRRVLTVARLTLTRASPR